MSLVRDWRKQVARAAGVSLIGPVALLLAGALVAAGGGLGGLGSLGQIATGPPLPDTGLAQPPRVSIDGPAGPSSGPGVAADPLAAAAATAVPAAGGGAPSAPGTGAAPGEPVTRVTPPGTNGGGPGTAPTGGLDTPAAAPAPGGGGPGPPAVAPVPLPAPAPGPQPLPDVLDEPGEVIESLPAPAGPLREGMLDALTGPSAP